MMRRKGASGAITIEACVTVVLFMMLMFILFGFFMIFMAQNAVAHVALVTAQSLAMDAWQVSKLQMNGFPPDVGTIISNLVAEGFGQNETNPWYMSETEWWKDKVKLENEIANRFLGYFSGGDAILAQRLMKAVRISMNGGADWRLALDFSESKVKNGELYVVVKYKVNYLLQIWGLDSVDMQQTAAARLWMKDAAFANSG